MSKNSTFLTRVALSNYKSIAACDIELSSLTFLVGQNGSGKSNFLDALRLLAEGLRTSLDHALRDRGGIHQVRRRSGGHPTHFAIRVDFRLDDGRAGHYSFKVGARQKGGYSVQAEECAISGSSEGLPAAYFLVEDGSIVRSTMAAPPVAASDRLYLVTASGLPEFRLLFEQLSRMGFYNINPDRMRDPHPADPGAFLLRDGTNAPSVLRRIAQDDPASKKLLEEYLSKVIAGLHRVDPIQVGPQETLEFGQSVRGARHPWQFFAKNMSDGTLRTVGLLIALFQGGDEGHHRVPLVGIEEPEMALHPAATGVLLDSLREASDRTQVIVTSHSPDLLDDPEIAAESILAVVLDDGTTQIGAIEEAARSALRDHLYTAGELLRLAQLAPDHRARVQPRQLKLFTGRAA